MPIDNNNMFSLTGINKTTDELVVMDIDNSTDNVSLHSSSNTNNIDTLNIKNILHKDTTKDLNICTYNNNSINPIIQINNTHQYVNIMSNLNIANNLNVSEKIKAQEIKINGIYINNSTGKFNEFSETTKTYTTASGTINSKIDTVTNMNGSSTNVSVRVIDMNTSQQDIMQPMYINPASGSVGNYITTNITSGAILNNGIIQTLPSITSSVDHSNINFTSNVCWCSVAQPSPANIDEIDYFITIDLSLSAKIYGIVTWPRKENSDEIYAGVSKFVISYSDDDVYYKFVCNGESNIYHKSTLCFGPNSILSSNDPQPIEFLANNYASSFSAKPTNWDTLSQIGVANYFNIKSRYIRIHIREIYGNRNNIQIRAHVIVDSNTNFQIANFNTGSVVAGGLSSTISTLGGWKEFGWTGIDVNGISKFNKGIDVTGTGNFNNFVIKKIDHTNITLADQDNIGVGTSTILTSFPEDDTKYSLLSSQNGDTIINGFNSVSIRLKDYYKWGDGGLALDRSNSRDLGKRDSLIKLYHKKDYYQGGNTDGRYQQYADDVATLSLGVRYIDMFYSATIDNYTDDHTSEIRWVNSINNDNVFGRIFLQNKSINIEAQQNIYFTTTTGSVYSNSDAVTSDDRIKYNETLLTNVTDILLKLRPQIYDKGNVLTNPTHYKKESGLIVQEIYYEIPELRYLITIPDDATLIDDNKYRNFNDIKNDPDYSNWGSTTAYLNYNGFIAYLIKGFQEHNTRITSLETENATFKKTIEELKTENTQQQTQINELISIINKLKKSTSFEEFKQTF